MKKRKTAFGEKPYNRCLSCPHQTVRCDGPRTAAMPLARWCEFMRDMKEKRGLTNADVAEKADISVKTVDRLMALNSDQDIMRETARRIEDAIIGSSNQYPCYLAYEEENPRNDQQLNEALRELERALADNKDYHAIIDNIHVSYNAEMQLIRDEAQKKIEHLLKQVEKLQQEADFLWAENNRKSNIIDMYLTQSGKSDKYVLPTGD